MSPKVHRAAETEIAHVLYLDLVGYSLAPMDEQAARIDQLQALLRATGEFRRGEAARELLCLPTGDGAALVFFRDPSAPLRCAIELGRALRQKPQLQVRMGLHSGPVRRVTDINQRQNVAGGGINLAQRVMNCADPGHILLSQTIAEFVTQLGEWSGALHDIGLYEIKHGERLHLFSFSDGTVGNPSRPPKLRGPPAHTESLPPLVPGAVDTLPRIVLLYKRHAQPDEYLLRLLETELSAQGCAVFIDRHLAVGVEWAREIERQIRTAAAVVPLLSEASIQSEMLAYEVELAHEAAQQQQGRPRLLPVRVAYTGDLSESLARILDPIQQTLWHTPEDDRHVAEELVAALQTPPAPRTTLPPPKVETSKLESVGGAVPLESRFYVVRPTDEEFRSAIARGDSIVLVKGARQMGKTSLLARGLQQARQAGAKVVLTDFQMFNAEHLESANNLFLTLAEWIAMQLDLDVLPQDEWNPRTGPNINFQRYLRRVVLGQLTGQLVWGLDEVDRLFSCKFGSEVFGLFRSWHNARSLDSSGPWSRLTLAIAYATEAHLFITDVNQSPFNVGTRLALEDFTLEQVADLNQRYGAPLRAPPELARFNDLLGGHPYLVRRGLNELVSRGLDIAAFEAQAGRDEGIFGDHLRRILVLLAKDQELYQVVRGVLQGQPCPTPESFFRLRSAGVMAGDSARDVRPRCKLYAAYLRRHLL
ncbi:MAG: AAA-like domain-containing protein [Verrucomicrobia bacterium]|nr:AAA-like domain-containing protein [Verrucomicrobiota bacterium]